MNSHLEKLDLMLFELRKDKNLELNLSKIVRTIETDLQFQSMAIFLKVPKSGIFRLKIGRNLSHNFEKNTIFRCHDPLIKELKNLNIINVKSQKRYKFELDFSHLIIIPLFNNKDLLGFLFMDKGVGEFSKEDITHLSIYSSVISLGANLDNPRNYIFHLNDRDEVSDVYNFKAFLQRAETLFSQAIRYNHDFSLVALKINNFENIIRKIGKENFNDLLKQISDTLRKNLRDTDLIGKVFSDTFALALPETSAQASIVPLNRLNDLITALPLMNGYKVGWGSVEFKSKDQTIQLMLRNAEEAAFEAVRNPKNSIIISK